ncbi:ABC transporter substrate-binding protein, partial [Leucobacter chromiiresistens]
MMRRKNAILTTAALATAAILGLAGCSAGAGNSSSDGGETPTTATIALTGTPTNLDFTTTAGSAIPQALMSNVYEGLVELDQSGEIQPLLASEWTVSDDRKTYTFTLQEGVTFSNGDEFTADDVKFSFDRVKTDWVSSLKAKMDVVDSVEVVSPTEVAVTLTKPSNAWLFSLATPVGAIFSEDGVDDLANTPVGTGPYAVGSWTPNESLVLDTRDDYWGEAPGVEQV